MKDRKPFKLTWVLIPYNLAMAVLNCYIAVKVSHIQLTSSFSDYNKNYFQLFTASTRLKYSYICEPCRQRYHPDELQVNYF